MTPENKKRAGAEDAGYAAWMAETVEPYLKEHGEKGYLKMEDGMSIAYRRYSLPDAGKCVVISHGFCEFAEKYNEVAYRFLQEGYGTMCRSIGDTAIPGARWMTRSWCMCRAMTDMSRILRGLWRRS